MFVEEREGGRVGYGEGGVSSRESRKKKKCVVVENQRRSVS